MAGRTSIRYPSGSSRARSTAVSRESTSTRKTPPSCSAVSAYGPSVTRRSRPLPGRRVTASFGSASASPATISPRSRTALSKDRCRSKTSSRYSCVARSQAAGSSSASGPRTSRRATGHAGADLDGALALAEHLADVDQVVEVRRLDHVEAGQLLGGLGVRALRDVVLAVRRGAEHARLVAGGELGPTGHLVSTLGEALGELGVYGVHLLLLCRRGCLPCGLVTGQENDVAGHDCSSRVVG